MNDTTTLPLLGLKAFGYVHAHRAASLRQNEKARVKVGLPLVGAEYRADDPAPVVWAANH